MGMQDDLLAAARKGDLLLSDAFPYIGDTYYLPKPMVRAGARSESEETLDEGIGSLARKASKKLAYIPAEQYDSYLDGSFDPIRALDLFNLGEASVQTKVNLARVHKEDADPYHVGSFAFNPGAGLYFMVRGSFDIAPVLEQLCYSGLSGKRSSGYGRFDYVMESKDPLDCLRASSDCEGLRVLLSSAAPKEDELVDALLDGASFRVIRKGGFVQSSSHGAKPQKKRDLYLFAAGSVFSCEFDGDVFDVNATLGAHPVYRYARAMWAEV